MSEEEAPVSTMEESDLLKERLQAITEKHRIQGDIRQKKLELDQEKLKLQHLKKKSLREQWLLQGSPSQNAADQQQTRALQLEIHRIEMEVESLEKEESMISTNESLILSRLRAVEKSSEDIIKEAQESFVSEPLQVTTVIPDVQESLSPPISQHSEPSTPRKTLFAMEINVSKNLSTGESTVLSTATVPPEELNQHTGLKVYDDGRKCVYALNTQEGSHDESCVSELSANEVQQLLRSATMHRQVSHQNQNQNHSRREEHCLYNQRDEGERAYQRAYSNPARNLRCSTLGRDWQRKTPAELYGHQETHYRRQEERNNLSNLRESRHLGNHRGLGHLYGNHKDLHYSLYQVRNCVEDNRPASRHNSRISRSSSMGTGSRANGYPPLRSHDQEGVSAYQPQFCYTPATYIPLRDYISVEEDELYCFNPASFHRQDGSLPPAPSGGLPHSDRVPSPLYRDDAPYTILNTVETTEPITAIFMGFQPAQDDSCRGQDFEGSLKAELVIIEDNEDNAGDTNKEEKKSHADLEGKGQLTGSSANGKVGGLEKETKRWVRPGIRKIQKKQKACCAVC